jgi:RNA polymerase sigma-70 factor (ECF subfamily)
MTVHLHPTALPTRSDEELVALVRAGHPHAFDAIVERYQARLLGFARQLLGGAHHDAEEVVQDAFVRALAGIRAGDNEILLKPWLHTIVRNRALDVLRRPVRTTDLEPHAPMLAARGGDPYAALATSEELRAVVGGLRALPERQRTALVMHELGGASHEAIGRRLGVSAGGSKALVHRARAGIADLRVAA